MALQCRIINGKVEAPNGRPSFLFQKLKDRFGEDKAFELYSLTEEFEYKDMLYLNTDSNGEMEESDFLKFVYRDEFPRDLRKEGVDLLQKYTPEQIKKLENIYEDGIFQPTYERLKGTGLFSEDEIYEVIYSMDRQIALKNFLENRNTLEISPVEEYRVELDEYNEIGMKPLMNPQEVLEGTIQHLLGAETMSQLEGMVETLPYQEVVDRFRGDENYRTELLEKVRNSSMVDIVRDEADTIRTLLNTMDVESLGDISEAAERIELLDDKALIVDEFEILVDNLVNAGVEIDFDEFSLMSKTVGELKEFSSVLNTFVNKPDLENTIRLSQQVDLFLEKDRQTLVQYNRERVNKMNLRYLDTLKSEVEIFNEMGLIRHRGNVFQKVNDRYSVDDLYNVLYTAVTRSPSIVGMENLPSIENSLEKLQDPINEEVVMEDLRDLIMNRMQDLGSTDIEAKEKIAIYRTFYGSEITPDSNSTVTLPLSNEDYLKEEFPSRFMKEKLSNKRENSKEYNNFYKYFKVDQKGIILTRDDQFTRDIVLNTMPDNIREDLLDYSTLSEALDLGVNGTTSDFSEMDRLRAQQNPGTLDNFNRDFQRVSPEEVVIKDSDEFIKIGEEVYEKTISLKDVTLYKKLPKSDGVYKNTNTLKPITNKTVQFLEDFVVTNDDKIRNKKYLTKQELKEINENNFACG